MADYRLINGNWVQTDFGSEGDWRLVDGVWVESTTAAAAGGDFIQKIAGYGGIAGPGGNAGRAGGIAG